MNPVQQQIAAELMARPSQVAAAVKLLAADNRVRPAERGQRSPSARGEGGAMPAGAMAAAFAKLRPRR